MRIFFAGSPGIAVPSLKIIASKYEICGVLTNPGKRSGRGGRRKLTPVELAAAELNLPVFPQDKIDSDFISTVKGLKPDLLVVVAYGKIFKKDFLDSFPCGGINLHPSILPVYRGPSPLTAAILNGDTETGVSIQKLSLKMDAGDIIRQEKIRLNGKETTGGLISEVSIIGARLLLLAIDDIIGGKAIPKKQDNSKASYCFIIKKSDGVIDWNSSAEEIERRIRAYNPWPLAHTSFGDKILNIYDAEPREDDRGSEETRAGRVIGIDKKEGILIKTGRDILVVKKLQLQSRKILDWRSFLNGTRNFVGSILGEK